MQYIPAALPSPIAIGLQQLMQGAMQGRMVDRQNKMQDSDLLKAMLYQKQMQDFNALSPEQQQPMQERQSIIDSYSPVNPGAAYRPSGVPQIPQFQSQDWRNGQTQSAIQNMLNPLQAQQQAAQLGLTIAQKNKLDAEAAAVGLPPAMTPYQKSQQELAERRFAYDQESEILRYNVSKRKATVEEARAQREEARKVLAEKRAQEKHNEMWEDFTDPATGKLLQRNKRTNQVTGRSGVNIKIGDQKLTDSALARLTGSDDVLRTTNELIAMMEPEVDPSTGQPTGRLGPGARNVGLWDNAIRAMKSKVGALSPEDQVWKQKFTELQRIIKLLNDNDRLAKDDFERLKTALPLEVLNDAAFRAGLVSLRDSTEISQRQIADDYIDLGYDVPDRFRRKPASIPQTPQPQELETEEDLLGAWENASK